MKVDAYEGGLFKLLADKSYHLSAVQGFGYLRDVRNHKASRSYPFSSSPR